MNYLNLVLLLLSCFQICSGQVITDQKEAERVFREDRAETETSKRYFAEDSNCRKFLRDKNYSSAEKSCRLVVSIAENLPKSRYMEKHSAYEVLGVALLGQRKFEEAILFFDKSLEVGKPNLDDTNAETGQIYYFLGQANHLLGNVEKARSFYTKAESTYRAAFKEIDADEIRFPYAKAIKNILEAHLYLVENADLTSEVLKIKQRLEELKTEFAKFLEN